MANKKNYSRYFVILQEEEKGYSIASDKLPSGYAKFEIKNDKCKISYYVQNLKKEMGPYSMLLICWKNDIKKLLNIGEMNIDDYGRTEVSFEYNADSILDSNIGIDKIVGAAIVKVVEKNVTPIMSGYTLSEAPKGWTEFEMISSNTEERLKDNEQEDEPEEQIPEYENEKVELEEHKEVRPNEDNTETAEPEADRESNKSVLEETDTEEETVNSSSENQEKSVFDQYEEEIESNKSNKSHEDMHKDMPIGAMGDFFKGLMKGFEPIADFSDEIKNCMWYKVPIINKNKFTDLSNYNKYTVVYYPMYAYYPYMKKHGHFVIGLKCDKEGKMKYIVYGVPGTKSPMDQPYAGRSGFVTWVPCHKKEEELGYWLMFYDFKNKTIVIPIKR